MASHRTISSARPTSPSTAARSTTWRTAARSPPTWDVCGRISRVPHTDEERLDNALEGGADSAHGLPALSGGFARGPPPTRHGGSRRQTWERDMRPTGLAAAALVAVGASLAVGTPGAAADGRGFTILRSDGAATNRIVVSREGYAEYQLDAAKRPAS